MAFFNRMQTKANRLNKRFANGAMQLVRVVPGTPPTLQTEALHGRLSGVPARWMDGETILASDELFEGAVPAMTPQPGDKLILNATSVAVAQIGGLNRVETDGRVLSVQALRPEFSGGLPVVMRFTVRG